MSGKMEDGMLSLNWNNHKITFCHILSTLREKEQYTDVTLACQGKFYQLHKLVLSACSEYFESIFENTPCKHPVIVLKDVKSDDLEALLSYMYAGVVNVAKKDVVRLMEVAKLLQIKGLATPNETPLYPANEKVRYFKDDRTIPPLKRKKCDKNGQDYSSPSSSTLSSPPSPQRSEYQDKEYRPKSFRSRVYTDTQALETPSEKESTQPEVVVLEEKSLVKEEIEVREDIEVKEDIQEIPEDFRFHSHNMRDSLLEIVQNEDASDLHDSQAILSSHSQLKVKDVEVEVLVGPSGIQGVMMYESLVKEEIEVKEEIQEISGDSLVVKEDSQFHSHDTRDSVLDIVQNKDASTLYDSPALLSGHSQHITEAVEAEAQAVLSVMQEEENKKTCEKTSINKYDLQGNKAKHRQKEAREQKPNLNSVIDPSAIKCFCGLSGNWYDRMLECQRCKHWFHETCVGCLRYKLICGDMFYLYVCEFCNDGREFLARLPISWENIVHLALWNLSNSKNPTGFFGSTYFEFEEQIVPWVNNHWELLQCTPKLQSISIMDRTKHILSALFGNSNKFECKKEVRDKSCIVWALKVITEPPSVLEIILPPESPITGALMHKISYCERTTELTPIPKTFKVDAADPDIQMCMKQQVKPPSVEDQSNVDNNKAPGDAGSMRVLKPPTSRRVVPESVEGTSVSQPGAAASEDISGNRRGRPPGSSSSTVQRQLRQTQHKCPFCEKSIKTLSGLKNHIRLHNKVKTITCPFCDYHAQQRDLVEAHILKKHCD